jgi:hypothetical protein
MTRAALVAFVLLPSVTATAVAAPPRIDPLRASDIEDGCGCSFHVPWKLGPKGRMILRWEIDVPASLRIDGRLRRLEVLTREEASSPERPARVGDKALYELNGTGIDARVECTVIGVCKPDDEACESTSYRAKITVRTPAGATAVDAWGSCGC